MSDDSISAMLNFYRNSTGSVAEMACADIRTLSAALDHERAVNLELTDQSERLRAEVKRVGDVSESRRVVLEQIRTYTRSVSGVSATEYFALGTVRGMVSQQFDVEAAK